MIRPWWVRNEASWIKNHKRALARCDDFLKGRLSMVEFVRQMGMYETRLREQDDPAFKTLRAINSQTRHFIVGLPRRYWAGEALHKMDIEITAAEVRVRASALEAAQRIILKYDSFLGEGKQIVS